MSKIKSGDIFTNSQGYACKVLEYKNSAQVVVQFEDEHKHIATVRATHLRSGGFKNPFHKSCHGVGYIGVGEYSINPDSEAREAYLKWRRILERCYSTSEKTRQQCASYDDCEVHPDWHNFQNFARWCVNQKHYGKEYEIDKDILAFGSKIYSEDTCCLVPKKLNNISTYLRTVGVEAWQGIRYDSKYKKYQAKISMGGYVKHIGSYNSLSDAKDAYIAHKKLFLRNMAIVYRDYIESKVFNALYNWTEVHQ